LFAGHLRNTVRIFLSGVLPLAWLPVAWFLGDGKFAWTDVLAQWIFVVSIMLLHVMLDERRILFIAGVAALASAAYVVTTASWIAWIALAAFYLVLIELDSLFTYQRGAAFGWVIHLILAFTAGATPVALVEIETHFADEEFFAAVQAGILAGFFLLLLVATRWLGRSLPAKLRIRFDLRIATVVYVLLALAGAAITVRSYQQSFYPPSAPGFQEISSAKPFLCGTVKPDEQSFDGNDVFKRLHARVEANPQKAAPEYGMLALGRGESRWAEIFRTSLLNEAHQGLFTGPANSVKFIQYDAALRVYYFSRVRKSFPDLFTAAEDAVVREWFASINRRALTVEWVDWMYGLAFAKWPEGPYENQENGAGLITLLESTGLAPPELSTANQSYLERNPRGWTARFRNTDDAFVYQPEWMTNAFYQSLNSNQAGSKNERLAFEWVLMQSLPDGASPGYNHPSNISLAGIAYLGARVLGDARYVWLAGKAVADAETRGRYLSAQPGVEQAVDILGRAPTQGSCLMYGDSGLPNQIGPIAPDKIVLRDGWSNDDVYALLNLRFTGWHRYKATNTLTFYQKDFLAADNLDSPPIDWLPVGRSQFRDKRIPRENLNGMLIEQTGLSAVLRTLTHIGSAWAQDPPFYATVEKFETGLDRDVSVTRMSWHGWQQSRTVYFYHSGGPTIVLDDAQGPLDQQAAIAWHLSATSSLQDQRMGLSKDAQIVFVPIGNGEIRAASLAESKLLDVLYYPSVKGQLGLVTVFLQGEWRGADIKLIPSATGMILQITHGEQQIALPVLAP